MASMSAREDARLVYQAFVDKEIAYLQRGLEEIEKQLSLSTKEGQADGVLPYEASASALARGESVREPDSLRITEVPERFHPTSENSANIADDLDTADKSVEYFGHSPEPHEPTKVLGWLLVGFAGFCVYVLGATIFKFWPVIVRTLR
jgi:hypothetical protein